MDYVPGYDPAVTRMLAARTAAGRAAFVPASVLAGARVLDVGCGPGTLTAGLARLSGRVVAVDHAAEVVGEAAARLPGHLVVRGAAAALPVADGAVDVVFAHALLEHVPSPADVLAEFRRVLRPGGTLAAVSSDWSGARITPPSPAAARVVGAYREVRRAAGGDPDAGARLAAWVAAAGFTVVHHAAHHRVDMAGPDLAAYLGERTGSPWASTWAAGDPPATVEQRWVEVLAHRP